MKKYYLIIVLFLFSCSENEDIYNVREQFIEVYNKKYYTEIDAITTEVLQPLLVEDFNNNSNNWQVGNSNGVIASISNGYFYMINNTLTDTYSSSIFLNSLTQNDNYQIEIGFKSNNIINSVNPKYNGLIFGFDNVGIKYNLFSEFLLNPKTIDLSATGNAFYKNLFSIRSDSMNEYWTQYNKYILRKIGSKIAVFVNNNYVKTVNIDPIFYGNRIGFAFNQILQVDYLYINKINL